MVWFALAPIVGQAAALFWLVRQAPGPVRRGERPPWSAVRSLTLEMVPFAVAFVALTIYYKIDVLLLAAWRSPADVGLYTAAYQFWDVAQALSLVAIAAVYPRLSRIAPQNGTGERWAGTRVTELLLLAVVPACALLWLLKGPLIETLYGASYVDATPVLGRLSPAFPALAVNLLAGYILAAAGRMTHVAALYAVGVVVNVVLNLLLVTSMGPLGAATAKLGSEVCCWPADSS